MQISQEACILFQGDSITDCGRNHDESNSLGTGYVQMIGGMLAGLHPGLGAKIFNRGISGNRTKDLLARWDRDCLRIQPDFLTIMVGINDVWRRYDSNDPTSPEAFEENYHALLTRTRVELPDTRILIIEPFLLHVPEDRVTWQEDLDPKLKIVRSLAIEFGTDYLGMNDIFKEAVCHQPPWYWAADGVHPSTAGHGLIARHWLEAVGAM